MSVVKSVKDSSPESVYLSPFTSPPPNRLVSVSPFPPRSIRRSHHASPLSALNTPKEDGHTGFETEWPGWKMYYSEEGYAYYYHAETQDWHWAPVDGEDQGGDESEGLNRGYDDYHSDQDAVDHAHAAGPPGVGIAALSSDLLNSFTKVVNESTNYSDMDAETNGSLSAAGNGSTSAIVGKEKENVPGSLSADMNIDKAGLSPIAKASKKGKAGKNNRPPLSPVRGGGNSATVKVAGSSGPAYTNPYPAALTPAAAHSVHETRTQIPKMVKAETEVEAGAVLPAELSDAVTPLVNRSSSTSISFAAPAPPPAAGTAPVPVPHAAAHKESPGFHDLQQFLVSDDSNSLADVNMSAVLSKSKLNNSSMMNQSHLSQSQMRSVLGRLEEKGGEQEEQENGPSSPFAVDPVTAVGADIADVGGGGGTGIQNYVSPEHARDSLARSVHITPAGDEAEFEDFVESDFPGAGGSDMISSLLHRPSPPPMATADISSSADSDSASASIFGCPTSPISASKAALSMEKAVSGAMTEVRRSVENSPQSKARTRSLSGNSSTGGSPNSTASNSSSNSPAAKVLHSVISDIHAKLQQKSDSFGAIMCDLSAAAALNAAAVATLEQLEPTAACGTDVTVGISADVDGGGCASGVHVEGLAPPHTPASVVSGHMSRAITAATTVEVGDSHHASDCHSPDGVRFTEDGLDDSELLLSPQTVTASPVGVSMPVDPHGAAVALNLTPSVDESVAAADSKDDTGEASDTAADKPIDSSTAVITTSRIVASVWFVASYCKKQCTLLTTQFTNFANSIGVQTTTQNLLVFTGLCAALTTGSIAYVNMYRTKINVK